MSALPSPNKQRPQRAGSFAAGLVVLIALCASLRAADGSTGTDTLATNLGPIGSFTLRDQDDREFSSDQLKGKVWVAHFFYVACKECNKTNPVMSELQKRIHGKPDLLIVSISLNGDAPSDLKRFSEDWKADGKQWIFLTGPRAAVKKLSQESFHLTATEAAQPEPGAEIEHDKKLVVVDRDGNFQGYIDRDDSSAVDGVVTRMGQIAGGRYFLSKVNAGLNALSGLLLVAGYVAVRRRAVVLHKALMLSALASSTIFLGCYLYYHFMVGSVSFSGTGSVRYVYFAILLSHTILAAVVAPLAVTVAYLGLKNRVQKHVRLARWTLPIWLYVSITGVVVYWMLYQLYPPY